VPGFSPVRARLNRFVSGTASKKSENYAAPQQSFPEIALGMKERCPVMRRQKHLEFFAQMLSLELF
jgi:hypothetical protein